MADGIEDAANAFATELGTPDPSTPARDQSGKFVSVAERPEPMFESRDVEDAGGDAGDDPELRAREREVADGRQRVEKADADDDGIPFEPVTETVEAPVEGEDDEKYEVLVNGVKQEVTLREALTGYVSQQQLAERVTSLDQMQAMLTDDYHRQQNNWALLIKARQDYEEDLVNLTPKEPDWDAEFAKDAQGAHFQQKIFKTIYDKLAYSREYRARMEAVKGEDQNRHTHRYAIDGFSKFVLDNKIPDEPTLKKEISSMRRTAADAGFSEYEVATVYDPRMLTVLRWASKYRRMMMARPRAVVAGKGKTLAPGSAAPIGAGRRGGLDDAQRRLASSGKLSDAVEVFRRIL